MQIKTPRLALRMMAQKRRARTWRKFVSVLACLVVFCTVYALMRPAITLESEPQCGKEAHTHTEACYTQVMGEDRLAPICTPESAGVHTHTDSCMDETGAYACGFADHIIHVHDGACFDAEGNLWCALPQMEPHVHTADCYAAPAEPETAPEPVCGWEEQIVHEHTPDCLDEAGNLICGQLQLLQHQHTDACFQRTQADSATLTCAIPEGEGAHSHSVENGCFDETGALICQQEESTGHQHGALCYGNWELTCPLEAHTHSDACFEAPAPTETEAEWTSSFAHVTLSGDWAQDTLAIAGTQLGYTESADNLAETPEGVTRGYTRYGDWWGDPYGPWSAMFVSFCMEYAGVPETAFPRGASCAQWQQDLWDAGLYVPASEGAPSEGDLVFFDLDLDGVTDHVGLVQALYEAAAPVLDEYDLFAQEAEETAPRLTGFRTLEGDRDVGFGDQVTELEYAIDNPAILGYGTLAARSEPPAVLAEPNTNWGYNPDGSIYWGGEVTLQPTALDAIDTDTAYVITGRKQTNVMTSVPDGTKLKADRPTTDSDRAAYAIWYFEKVSPDAEGYYIRTGAPDSPDAKYLNLDGEEALTLADQKEAASVFTVAQQTLEDCTHCLLLQSNSGPYLNVHGDDLNTCTGFGGWSQPDSGSSIQLLSVSAVGGEKTANRLTSDISTNTVINLFDYWIAPNRTDPDKEEAGETGNHYSEGGINKNHAFKFSTGDGAGTLNKWTEAGNLPLQGIVKPQLSSSGYPVLSGNHQEGLTGFYDPYESLEYLFNPEYQHEGKISFRNVGSGLLQLNKEGYYAFDCKKYMAEFDEEKKTFNIYDKPGVYNKDGNKVGQFFPFNQAPQIMEVKRDDALLNHYFGMTLTTRFIQQHGGYSDDKKSHETSFHFSGDDDVWIFIDGVLVGDVGGIHDASTVNINFVTGKVEVVVAGHENDESKKSATTLYTCYEEAGRTGVTQWNDQKTTYADGTTHTLKFYFLERGNYDSNMELRYNLTEIPETAIYKVDQYGNPVKDAMFAVYAADSNYQMLSGKGGVPVTVPEEPTYDEAGNLLGTGGSILAHSLYTGVTDEDGEMVFVDGDGMPYSLVELQDMFGDNFILQEIKVPEGYRVVRKDVHLRFWRGMNQTILRCDNTMDSGTRASSTLQITATDTLYILQDGEIVKQPYCDADTGTASGTLFAVVYRYTGPIGTGGLVTIENLGKEENWTPVYGSDKEGYTLVEKPGGSMLKAAVEAAKKGQEYGDVVFEPSLSSTMQLTVENLPGHITQYYRMLSEAERGKTRYTLGYYWSTANSLEEVTPENTYRALTHDDSVPGVTYSGFERIFGANIQVPDLINKILVQKMDENNGFVNGATFALYRVREENNKILYLAENGSYVALDPEAKPDDGGVIRSGGKTIRPLETQISANLPDGIHKGTAAFSNLEDGQYIVKEVKAPPGFKVNTSDVMVLITEDTIYANAGTEDDGITIGRGPGYVVSTLNTYASDGQLDNTLTWIYAQLVITKPSTSFADVFNPEMTAGYLKENNTAEAVPQDDAARTYLMYAVGQAGTTFNYVPNKDRHGDHAQVDYRRLFTTAGWSQYKIYQDYVYGSEKAKQSGANYEDWRGDDLTNLFSRSTYIRFYDEQETAVTVRKVDAGNLSKGLSGAEFRLYRLKEDGATKEYYQARGDDGTVLWSTDAAQAKILTTGEDGTSEDSYTGLKDGEYDLEEIKAPAAYYLPKEPVHLTITQAKLKIDATQSASIKAEEAIGDDNLYTYTVVVPNSSGYKLPDTGGVGTAIFHIPGLLLTLGAAFLLTAKRRKQKT